MQQAPTPYDIIDPHPPAFEADLSHWLLLLFLLLLFWIGFALYRWSSSKRSKPLLSGELTSLQDEIRSAGRSYLSEPNKERLSYFIRLFRRYLSQLSDSELRTEFEAGIAPIEKMRFARRIPDSVSESMSLLLRRFDDVG